MGEKTFRDSVGPTDDNSFVQVHRFFKEKLEAAYPLDNTSSHDVVESQRIAHEV